ncbi:MAG: cobalamin-dependent protein [Anaerolineales bacterium]|nr:cobalamin-dependent protein [Anaerolineales bacterium]
MFYKYFLDSTPSILELITRLKVAKHTHFPKGKILFEQGENVESLYIIKSGTVKILYLSVEGKAHTFEILGAGRALGLNECLLGETYQSTAQTLQSTDVLTIKIKDLHTLLGSNPDFSKAIMREQAISVQSLNKQVRQLSMADVQQRLKNGLVKLADQHGLVTKEGIRIDLPITHGDLAELIAANRTTITLSLKELERQGYVWKKGRQLFIVRPEHIAILDGLSQSVLEADDLAAERWARQAILQNVSPFRALDVLTAAIRQVDRGFSRGTLSLPDVVGSAVAMKKALPIIEAAIARTGIDINSFGTIVIGTVQGDIHDIGKTMSAILLSAAGFKVIDLGVDVALSRFIEAVIQHKPDILAMSALMSITAKEQKVVINTLEQEGLRDKIRIMVGGGGVTHEHAAHVGADGYESTAQGAVELAVKLVQHRESPL